MRWPRLRNAALVVVVGVIVYAASQTLDSLEPFDEAGAAHGPGASETARSEQTASTGAPGGWEGASPSRQELQETLGRVTVADRTETGGYDRDCGTGHSCSFGQAWTDDTSAPGGHNGCDQRNDILRSSLENVTVKPGTDGCVVMSGTLDEPYTGQQVTFSKAEASLVQIDHIYPLARAWDMGAAAWSLEQRTRFATDPINLIAVDGSSNASKGDQGPGEWMPINRAYRCAYAGRYLDVALSYDLPITSEDEAAIQTVAQTCPEPRPAPSPE